MVDLYFIGRNDKMNELYHHGIKGQKWGVRRFQNKDGSLTSAGKRRFKSVASNEKKHKFHTESAKFLLEGNAENERVTARELKEAYKDFKDFGMSKKESQFYKQSIKDAIQKSKTYEKLLKDIDSGKIKAGRDFVTNLDRKGHFKSVEDGIIFKKSDSEIARNRYKIKDDKTYSKNGIKVERDSQNRVISLKATNANRKQIKRINKMQRSINRKGDY